jgi:hypothetical protein
LFQAFQTTGRRTIGVSFAEIGTDPLLNQAGSRLAIRIFATKSTSLAGTGCGFDTTAFQNFVVDDHSTIVSRACGTIAVCLTGQTCGGNLTDFDRQNISTGHHSLRLTLISFCTLCSRSTGSSTEAFEAKAVVTITVGFAGCSFFRTRLIGRCTEELELPGIAGQRSTDTTVRAAIVVFCTNFCSLNADVQASFVRFPLDLQFQIHWFAIKSCNTGFYTIRLLGTDRGAATAGRQTIPAVTIAMLLTSRSHPFRAYFRLTAIEEFATDKRGTTEVIKTTAISRSRTGNAIRFVELTDFVLFLLPVVFDACDITDVASETILVFFAETSTDLVFGQAQATGTFVVGGATVTGARLTIGRFDTTALFFTAGGVETDTADFIFCTIRVVFAEIATGITDRNFAFVKGGFQTECPSLTIAVSFADQGAGFAGRVTESGATLRAFGTFFSKDLGAFVGKTVLFAFAVELATCLGDGNAITVLLTLASHRFVRRIRFDLIGSFFDRFFRDDFSNRLVRASILRDYLFFGFQTRLWLICLSDTDFLEADLIGLTFIIAGTTAFRRIDTGIVFTNFLPITIDVVDTLSWRALHQKGQTKANASQHKQDTPTHRTKSHGQILSPFLQNKQQPAETRELLVIRWSHGVEISGLILENQIKRWQRAEIFAFALQIFSQFSSDEKKARFCSQKR